MIQISIHHTDFDYESDILVDVPEIPHIGDLIETDAWKRFKLTDREVFKVIGREFQIDEEYKAFVRINIENI